MNDEPIETDVLVVGGGGAGLRAAIEAKENGVGVILVSKGPAAKSGASLLAGADLTLDGKSLRDLGFPGEPRDSKQKFFNDIVTQGFYLNNQKLVEIYVQDAPKRVKELLEWGIKISARGSEERAIFTTGPSIVGSLLRKAKEVGVEIIDDVMLIDLLTKDGRVTGALGVYITTGEFVTFKSKAVVLATGGWHKAYSFNAGTRELSGDGHAMAYRVGAEMVNMEFVTFINNTLLWPPMWRGSIFLYIVHRIIGGRLVNGRGERFLDKYHPEVVKIGTLTEWDKCFLSFVSMLEVIEGRGSPHGGVYFEVGDMPWEEFESKLTKKYPGWKFKGIDFSELGRMLKEGKPVEVGVAAEYFEGGVDVNERFETSIPGLYAAGECAVSLFGANRIAAATTEMLVGGAIAGRSAAQYAKKVKMPEIDREQVDNLQERATRPLRRKEGIRPVELMKRVQRMTYEKLGPIRDGAGLKELIEFIERVKRKELPKLCTSSKNERYNKEWIEALELENIVQVLEIAARSALMRTESRGVHHRSDHPYTDNDNWLKEIVSKRMGMEPFLSTRPIIVTTLTPIKGKVPYLEMVKKMMEAHSEIGGCH
jgi:succinate dehydrogenase/fumarate reductase flavoprotein subunit